MSKMLVINACYQCDNFYGKYGKGQNHDTLMCAFGRPHKNRALSSDQTIPPWCPLPDYDAPKKEKK
jgi:hypothetical protein